MPGSLTRLYEMIMTSTGDLTTGGIVLRLALAALSMFATIHYLSLWGTRYGDNNTLSKSFFLSLVIHGCLGLGWATVAENNAANRVTGSSEVVVSTPITFIDTESVAPVEGTNRLPIFQSGPATLDSALIKPLREATRFDRDDIVSEVDSPQIDKSPNARLLPDVPDFAAAQEEMTPYLEEPKAASPKFAAANDASIEQPALEARPEATSSSAAPSRASLSRPAVSADAVPRSDSKRGASLRTTSEIEEGTLVTFPSETTPEGLPRPQGFPNEEGIRRQGSPHPSHVVDPEAGSGTEGDSRATETIARRANRMTRPTTIPGDSSESRPRRPQAGGQPSINRRSTDERMLIDRGTTDLSDESPAPVIRAATPSMSRLAPRAPETYQARTLGQRMASVLKNGGSEDSEKAVERSLKWLASVQEPAGNWSAGRHGGGAVRKDPQGQERYDGGKFADSGITGLVILSYLGAGYTHENGPYTKEVRRGLNWLIACQKRDGYLDAEATRFDKMYCHAMATFALAEAYAMQKDANDYPELRTAVVRGVKFIASMQNEDGGWRYITGVESDMSMFGWQLMALKSAVNAGITVPKETRAGMLNFLDSRSIGTYGGLAGYRKSSLPTPAMTAEALFCRQMFKSRDRDAASKEATAYLLKNLPRVTSYDEYYWYYGTLAMHNMDDESWQEWNRSLRDMLISLQRQDEFLGGSWDPKGKWAGIGGRLYSTALSTMCLEVYYRYQSTDKVNAPTVNAP